MACSREEAAGRGRGDLPAELPVSCHIAKWRQELYKAWRWSNGAAACGSGAARTGRQARSGRRVSAAPTVAVPSLQVERSAPLPMPRVFQRARAGRDALEAHVRLYGRRALSCGPSFKLSQHNHAAGILRTMPPASMRREGTFAPRMRAAGSRSSTPPRLGGALDHAPGRQVKPKVDGD